MALNSPTAPENGTPKSLARDFVIFVPSVNV
jgi:hypothetical protein